MGALRQLVHLLLQRPRRPVDGEVEVLEQHPAAAAVRGFKRGHGDWLLALAQRDGSVAAALGGVAQARAKSLDAGGLGWGKGELFERVFGDVLWGGGGVGRASDRCQHRCVGPARVQPPAWAGSGSRTAQPAQPPHHIHAWGKEGQDGGARPCVLKAAAEVVGLTGDVPDGFGPEEVRKIAQVLGPALQRALVRRSVVCRQKLRPARAPRAPRPTLRR